MSNSLLVTNYLLTVVVIFSLNNTMAYFKAKLTYITHQYKLYFMIWQHVLLLLFYDISRYMYDASTGDDVSACDVLKITWH